MTDRYAGPMTETLPFPLVRRGKVRDVYALPPARGPGAATGRAAHGAPEADARLLIVATDRISAFDVIMPTPVPGKGRLLTRLAAFWFRFIAERRLAETHVLATDVAALDEFGLDAATRGALEGRITIGRACRVIPIECVVRGYLEGSGWREYQESGAVCGVALPAGLRQCERLAEPIFTPATKAETGHDENISFEAAAESLGPSGLETMATLREISLGIYRAASAYALERGIIIADTKFEFGLPLGSEQKQGRVWQTPILIDEALTPDSSRFWPADRYAPGRAQPSYDKQFLREYLETLVARGEWNKRAPGPPLPDEVVRGTLARYEEAAANFGA